MNIIKSIGPVKDFDRVSDTYKDFEFYILSNEHGKHYPHVHICLKDPEHKIKGARINMNYLGRMTCIATLRLTHNFIYDMNLEFEDVFNDDYIVDDYKYLYLNWLYMKNRLWNNFNAIVCVELYMAHNKVFKNIRKYKENISDKNLDKNLDKMIKNACKVLKIIPDYSIFNV